MDHTSCCICKTVSFRELSNAIFKNDIKEILNFTFFQLYNYIVVITEKYNGDLLGGIHKVRTQLGGERGSIKSVQVRRRGAGGGGGGV